MTLTSCRAIVLHASDYQETSRIIRLLTRDNGIQSVLARGMRKSSSRFGTSLDLFAEGEARIDIRPGRDLQALIGFDVVESRLSLAMDLSRFSSAAVVGECALRLLGDEYFPEVWDLVNSLFTRLEVCSISDASEEGLAGLWQLVAALGYAPALDSCAQCYESLDDTESRFNFSHVSGGILCRSCSGRGFSGRVIPSSARSAISAWLEGSGDRASSVSGLTELEVRAHQRLLREFLDCHLVATSSLRSWRAWEQGF